jgi:amino acid adenylation domain-containing protein
MSTAGKGLQQQQLVTKPSTDFDDRHFPKGWNATQATYPKNLCLHQLFEAQVAKTPDAVAVVFENKQLTYRQLNDQGNQLAHHLLRLGVGPEVLVGLYLERSLEMVVGLLGVLKAGGAYVPLDPTYPADRLTFILEDTQVPLILTQAQWAASLPTHHAKVICLDSGWEAIAQESLVAPLCEATAKSLAYVIYTSGSTGRPKGVMIPHSGLCNQLYWRQTTFPLTAADRILQTISFSFDPSVWQIFWPLSFGAQLVLPRPNGQKDTAYLVQTIAQQQITVIALVPSMLRVLLAEKEIAQCHCLKHVFCGGEALPLDVQTQFFARMGARTFLHNVYGPTEASIDASFWTCQREAQYPIAPIGRPIANAQIHILDRHLQPVAIGAPGEIYIGGAGLARGYLNRPELTAERFIPDPNSLTPETYLYKTGDLARYLSDGNVEFLGRIDYQVKLRGFRIELEEIEATLSQQPGVQQSVVLAREDVPGHKRLVAYVVPDKRQTVTSDALRCFLKEKLPEYMVPSAFVLLEALPLSANGKIDRQALPIPEPMQSVSKQLFVPSQDPLKLELTTLWEQILNVQPISIQDDFFTVGGDSLLAIRLLTEIEVRWGKKLPIAVFTHATTIEQFADILRQETWNAPPEKALVAIQPNGSKPPLFCIHSKSGNVLNYYELARYLGSDQPCYGLQAPSISREQITSFRVEALATDYIKAIQTLQPSGPYFLSGYSFGGLVAYEMARQLHKQGETVALLALFDTYNKQGNWFQQPLALRGRVSRYLRQLVPFAIKEKLRAQGKWLVRFNLNNQLEGSVQEKDPVQIACEEAVKKYRPQSYPGRISLFRALESHELPWLKPVKMDAQLGWGKVAIGGVDIQELPCHHFNLLLEPNVEILAKKLKTYLQ